jgi:hypothetical protein
LQVRIIHPTSLEQSGDRRPGLDIQRNTRLNPPPRFVPVYLAACIGIEHKSILGVSG